MSTVDPAVIEGKIKQALAKVLSIDASTITADQKLVEDLKIDSFAGVELVFEVEDLTGIEILTADFINLKTVADVRDFICKRLESGDVKKQA